MKDFGETLAPETIDESTMSLTIKGFDGDFISGSIALLVDGLAGTYVDNFRVEGRNVKKLN